LPKSIGSIPSTDDLMAEIAPPLRRFLEWRFKDKAGEWTVYDLSGRPIHDLNRYCDCHAGYYLVRLRPFRIEAFIWNYGFRWHTELLYAPRSTTGTESIIRWVRDKFEPELATQLEQLFDQASQTQ